MSIAPIVPAGRASLRMRLLARVVDRLRATPAGRAPARWHLILLSLAWGNLAYAASLSYLRRVGQRVIETRGPILECGSGATTLLMGALTAARGTELVVFEHHRAWFEHLRGVLAALGLRHVRLCHVPLIDYGEYRWYEVRPGGAQAGFELVVCDGPPGSTPGGRYGLLPVMGAQLAPGCVILLDDTHRRAERHIIERWRQLRRLVVRPQGPLRRFTELVLQEVRPAQLARPSAAAIGS